MRHAPRQLHRLPNDMWIDLSLITWIKVAPQSKDFGDIGPRIIFGHLTDAQFLREERQVIRFPTLAEAEDYCVTLANLVNEAKAEARLEVET